MLGVNNKLETIIMCMHTYVCVCLGLRNIPKYGIVGEKSIYWGFRNSTIAKRAPVIKLELLC